MRRGSTFTAWMFMAPALLILSVFLLYPIICGSALAFFKFSLLSFTPQGDLRWPEFVGLSNFRRILHDRYFWTAFSNSFLYLLVVPPLQLGAAIVAINLQEASLFNKIARTCIYIPVITSSVVVGIVWKWLLRSDGLINQALGTLGVTAVPWLTDSRLAIFSIMLVTLWQGIGYYMILYLAGLQSIPSEYSEAARLDGASSTQIMVKITLPLLKPTAALCTLISSISALKVFTEVYVMTGGGPQNSTLTAAYFIYSSAFENYDLGYAATASLILAAAIALLSWLNYRLFSSEALSGAK